VRIRRMTPATMTLRARRGNAIAVEHLTNLWRFLRTDCQPPESMDGFADRDSIEELTGQPPQSLSQFLREHKEHFSDAVAH
jgi:hypothetical protein